VYNWSSPHPTDFAVTTSVALVMLIYLITLIITNIRLIQKLKEGTPGLNGLHSSILSGSGAGAGHIHGKTRGVSVRRSEGSVQLQMEEEGKSKSQSIVFVEGDFVGTRTSDSNKGKEGVSKSVWDWMNAENSKGIAIEGDEAGERQTLRCPITGGTMTRTPFYLLVVRISVMTLQVLCAWVPYVLYGVLKIARMDAAPGTVLSGLHVLGLMGAGMATVGNP
ncbi:hypothetical protein HK102_007410, partial [Quaeritorhiza haematococci]